MILLQALRNLGRNWKNSLLVILLIATITALFFIGNTLIQRSDSALRESYIESITGDLLIQEQGEVSMSVFGANTPVIGEFFSVPVLSQYERVREIVAADPEVALFASQVSGAAEVRIGDVRFPAPLFGVETANYFRLLEGLRIVEGGELKPGVPGVLLSLAKKQEIEERSGQALSLETPVKLTTAESSGLTTGFRIREVPLKGFFAYANPGTGMNEIVIADPITARALNSITIASGAEIDLPDEAVDLLTQEEEALFGASPEKVSAEDQEGIDLDSMLSSLQAPAEEIPVDSADGDWNFLLVKAVPGISVAGLRDRLNEKLAEASATAVGWRTAAGDTALLVLLLRALFNGGFLLVGLAGVIAIVNILLIAVFRRTREIGTLRAIGASDGYIIALVYVENLTSALVAGISGVCAGFGLLWSIEKAGVTVENPLVASLLGGSRIEAIFFWPTAVGSLAAALCIGAAASAIPVLQALRIEPIVAVQRG